MAFVSANSGRVPTAATDGWTGMVFPNSMALPIPPRTKDRRDSQSDSWSLLDVLKRLLNLGVDISFGKTKPDATAKLQTIVNNQKEVFIVT